MITNIKNKHTGNIIVKIIHMDPIIKQFETTEKSMSVFQITDKEEIIIPFGLENIIIETIYGLEIKHG
jgi:hypothetical protein